MFPFHLSFLPLDFIISRDKRERFSVLLLYRKYRYDISGITTKATYEAALICERHVRIEIAGFVMRTFVLPVSL